jgi:hypothetical protein
MGRKFGFILDKKIPEVIGYGLAFFINLWRENQ